MPDAGRLIYLVLLLVAIGGFLIFEFAARPGRTLRQMAAWGMIFLGMVALAGLWEDIRHRILPGAHMLDGSRIEVPLSQDGHFRLQAQVNGAAVLFVVDTGATTIALAPGDARRAGIEPQSLSYLGEARTANGVVSTATVVLDSLTIGDIRDEKVPALVLRSGLDLSLMGMSYLSRFARVSIEGDRLILER